MPVSMTTALVMVVRMGFFARVMIGVPMSHLDSIPLSRSAIHRVAPDAKASWRHPE